MPTLQPGPHSALADIDLPAGTVPTSSATEEHEFWRYTAPYADIVTFLQTQFATGRRYDAYGATSWQNLPPCYNDLKYNPADPAHESPPRGWIFDNNTQWYWSDTARSIGVFLSKPGGVTASGDILPYGVIHIWSELGPATQHGIKTCNRA
jgi:hypothetical protein